MKNYSANVFDTKKIITRLIASSAIAACLLITQSFFIVSPAKNFNNELNCDSVPRLNKQIVAYLETKINHKVGEGECWDLAAEALNTVGAKWDHEYRFGHEIDNKKECIFPGDIIQFTKVKISYKLNNTYYLEHLPEHTAIVYEVSDQDNFSVAEQNTSRLGQKVGITPFNFKNVKSGKIKIYRPYK